MTPELESSIYIYLITAERTTRTNFAGTGVTRRRSTVITKVLAEHLIDRLSINYRFFKYGVRIERKELVEFLHLHLMAVPDDIAKASGTRTSASEPASKAIAHGLFLALDMEYSRQFESQDPFDPASPRYVNRVKA
ncbi:hypothetical protein G6L37_11960 [Agrobacterium rubi]|uniref:hypothetical protein n=1 Tax=Agrobacterium rubi TaxID=28099 RepID=UPI00157337CF|nr:hypothetical protein [Agrobacterium rubi]NTF06877.1 hypothetical protein [Agrobacterium rubi]NTF19119.1 hypothetical protein [Agrobacterium rubi]NTF26082.1 hypothetical protein [Agrobacterium rubi]